MRDNIVKNKYELILLFISFIFILTPIYSIGYLLLSVATVRRLKVMSVFDSYISRVIFSIILLLCSIMVVGIATSYINIPNYAVFNYIFALSVYVAAISIQKNSEAKKVRLINTSDITGILAGLLIPVVILSIHFVSSGVNVGLFRIVNADGWDNAPHLNFLQVNSANKNYFYPTSPMVIDGDELHNVYPQGWHLASSNVVDGVYPGALDPTKHGLTTTLATYVAIVFAWYFLASFVLVKSIWSLLSPSRASLTRLLAVLIVAHAPILMFYLSLLSLGFVNYLGLMPLILIVFMLSVEYLKKRIPTQIYILVSTVLIAGVTLTWALPGPVLALLVCLCLARHYNRLSFKLLLPNMKTLPIYLLVFFCLTSLVAYGGLLFNGISVGQLQAGSPWSSMPQLPTAIFTGLIIVFLLYSKPKNRNDLLLLLSPFLVTILMFWLYSYLKADHLGYYNAKVLGTLFIVVSVVACASIVSFVENMTVGAKSTVISGAMGVVYALSVVSLILITSGQTIDFKQLRKNNYYLLPVEVKTLANWMYSQDLQKDNDQILLEREDVFTNPSRAMIFNHVTVNSAARFLTGSRDSAYTCLQYVYWDKDGNTVTEDSVYNNISNCIKKRAKLGMNTTILAPHTAKSIYQEKNIPATRYIFY